MKKTTTLICLLLCLFKLSAQPVATFRVGSIDATGLQPGDTIYVPVYCDTISCLLLMAQLFIEFDHSVLSWTGEVQNIFGNELYWLFNDNGSEFVILYDDPAGPGIYIPPGQKLFEVGFMYYGGETLLNWGLNSEGCCPDFGPITWTFINGCVCDFSEITFHVTIDGNDLEGALVSVGNETIVTNTSGIAVFNLQDGDYSYNVTREGYVEEEGTFTVTGEPLLVELEMEVCYSVSFHVVSSGGTIENFIVIINNDTISSDTLSALCLPTGSYPVTIIAPGYFPFSGELYINGSPVTFNIILFPITYSVTFFINCCGEPQEGITIVFNGQAFITGPDGILILSLPEGGSYSICIGGYIFNFNLPGTTYIDADICRELTYHSTDEQGNPIEDVLISMGQNSLSTDNNGEADICLQVGSYNYVASKPGYITQSGSFEMDTIPQTVEIVMPEETFSVTFQVSGLECENEFEGLIIIINGDTLLPGETINLANGTYYFSVVHIGCGIQYDGPVTVNNTPETVNLYAPGLPQVTFHVTDQWLADFEGAAINVEDDILYTDYLGEVSFCVTGGYHDYWVANPGYDTIPNSFVFPCQDTTIEFMLMTGSIGKEKMAAMDIYPNPSSGKFYFETANWNCDPVKLEVIDLTGRIVYESQPAIREKFEIDLTDKPKGLFFLRIKTEAENYTQKLMIQ